MTYTGDVTPSGPADERTLARLTITKVAVDEQMSNNAYFLRDPATGATALIDPAAEWDRLSPHAGSSLSPVIVTHQHWDHHRALADAVAGTRAALAPGGVLLATLPGISQVSAEDRAATGDFWRFTADSAQRLFADAYGAVGLRCETAADVDATITRAMEIDDQPVVVDFTVSRDAMVWPMVAAGTSNDDIKYARDLAPQFDEDDL